MKAVFCNFCGSKHKDARMIFGEPRLKTFICAGCIESAVFQLQQNGIEPFVNMIQPNVLPFRMRQKTRGDHA